jgi:type I restriction-modification system DNA methylase subunit
LRIGENPIMPTINININEKANLIWAIADKLTGPYKPHEYGEVILPLTVIRVLIAYWKRPKKQ